MRIGFIEKLIEIVENSGIDEIEVSRFGTRIRISKNLQSSIEEKTGNTDAAVIKREVKEKEYVEEEKEEEKTVEKEEDLHKIKSPMVGTFYRAPAPDAPPYVEEGDMVRKGDVVCIIEAMKIMNEIESDIKGEIVEILVSNEDPVEYNQDLFVVRKS